MSFPQQPTHTRVEFEVEPEPVLIESAPNLFLPESWVEERRSAFAIRWLRAYMIGAVGHAMDERPYAVAVEGMTDGEIEKIRRTWITADPRISIVFNHPMAYIPFGDDK
jgi:hypothetical protein